MNAAAIAVTCPKTRQQVTMFKLVDLVYDYDVFRRVLVYSYSFINEQLDR